MPVVFEVVAYLHLYLLHTRSFARSQWSLCGSHRDDRGRMVVVVVVVPEVVVVVAVAIVVNVAEVVVDVVMSISQSFPA